MPRTNGETLLWHQEGLLNGRISEENLNQRQSSFLVFLRTRAANQSSTSRKTYRTSSTSMSICRTIFWENTWRKMEELGNITKLRQTTSRQNCRRKNRGDWLFLKFGRKGMKSSRKMKEMQKYYLIYLYLAIAIANAFYVIYLKFRGPTGPNF